MADGGDLFDPARLRKLWEPKPESEFEKREREEKELEETEPTLVALDLFEQIVRTCRRKLGGRAAKLEPVFKHARGLLAMKLAVDRKDAAPAPPPEAAPAAPAPGAKKAPEPEKSAARKRWEQASKGRLDNYDRADKKIARELKQAMHVAGLDKVKQAEPESSPTELGAALDMIEDLYEVLSSGSR